jgi:hypothetical protein
MTYIANVTRREGAALPDGRQWRGPNAIGDIARTLIGEGAEPGAKLQLLRHGQPVLEGTIAAFAGRKWAGTDADPRFRRWCPHPRIKMPPRLVAWATRNGFMGHQRHFPTGDAPEGAGDGGAP